MLSDQVLDKVIERVTNRIEQANTYVLEQIGKKIKEIGSLSATNALQLESILKYGGDYEKIAQKLAEITNLNVQDIYKIFEEVAKSDYKFAGKFYKYRNRKYIPYEFNYALQNEVQAMANITANTYLNISKTLAFAQKTPSGIVYTDLAKTYQETIDKAITSIYQGKATFQEEMYKTIKELSNSGIRTIDYDSGRSYRLDSAVKSAMRGGLSNLHNGIQEIIAKDIDADGVEISVHEYPAVDHEEAQGKQFSLEEYKKLQETGIATTYDKIEIDMHLELKDGSSTLSFRPIRAYNCQHFEFYIVLGVSKPEYSNKQLQEIRNRNDKGFDYGDKHYTMYEGTQLQRQIELAVRKQKDTQIMAKASYNSAKPEEKDRFKELIEESQEKITMLTDRYKELSDISGLPTKMERMRVPSYKRINVKKLQ